MTTSYFKKRFRNQTLFRNNKLILGSTPGAGPHAGAGPHHVGTSPHAGADGTVGRGDKVDINQIFDILPIMGTLEPGASQTVTFSYFGLAGQKFEAMALCQAEGGPEYELRLKGEASKIKYKVDKTELDFGEVVYSEVLEKEIWLANNGKVAYYYNFNLSLISRPYVVDVNPVHGQINPDDKQKVVLRLRAGEKHIK